MEPDERTQGASRDLPVVDDAQPPYVIRVKGHLDARWAASFDGMHLVNEDDGTTTIRGPVVDQAALHGLLHRLRDAGIPLLSLAQVDLDHQHDHRPTATDIDGTETKENRT